MDNRPFEPFDTDEIVQSIREAIEELEQRKHKIGFVWSTRDDRNGIEITDLSNGYTHHYEPTYRVTVRRDSFFFDF